jgi:hypothetical protein
MIAAYEARCSAGTEGVVLAGIPVELIVAGCDGANWRVQCRIAGRLTFRGHGYRGYTSISDKESQKQSTSNHSACSCQWTLSRLAGLSKAGTTYVRGAKQFAAAEMAWRSVCAESGKDGGPVLRSVRCCHVG